MSRPSRKRTIIAIASVVGLVAVVFVGAAIDASRTAGRVGRRVTLAGQSVGGQTAAELAATTIRVAETYRSAAVHVRTPAGELVQTAAALGLSLDETATVQATMAADQDGGTLGRPVAWIRSLFSARSAPLVFTVDPATLAAGIATLDAANRTPPTKPTIIATESGISPVPGKPGAGIDAVDLAAKLEAAAETSITPIVVDVATTPTAPRFTEADAKAVAAKANSLTVSPLVLSIGGKSATLSSTTLRSWLTAAPGPSGLELRVDQAKVVAELPPLIGDLGSAPVQIGFTLAPDPDTKKEQVSIIDGVAGTRCCAPDSAARIATAITAGQSAVTLDLESVPPDHDHAWAESLKIVEPIGTFTTQHQPPNGVDRVANIHRIADAVRGMYIEPGATFSVNERVGQRTKEKGYVEAPVIYNATHDTDVGGGVSQFATTFFNASFFAGLDLVDYQSHSLFIDRYPYGREATISWPKPDLKIGNNTPYGVLVWTTYTDTSLTITLYSTKWVSGDQTGQSKEAKGECTKVTTERTRTFVDDGHTETDKVFALYQPADGVSCN